MALSAPHGMTAVSRPMMSGLPGKAAARARIEAARTGQLRLRTAQARQDARHAQAMSSTSAPPTVKTMLLMFGV